MHMYPLTPDDEAALCRFAQALHRPGVRGWLTIDIGRTATSALYHELPLMESVRRGCASYYVVRWALSRIPVLAMVVTALKDANSNLMSPNERLSDGLLRRLMTAAAMETLGPKGLGSLGYLLGSL